MSTANKRKGAAFEIDVLKYLRAEGYDVERLRLSGKEDEGDLVLKVGGLPYIFEAKNEQKVNLSGWVREAGIEAVNYAKHRDIGVPLFAVVHKKRNDGIGNAYVTTPLHEFLRIITP